MPIVETVPDDDSVSVPVQPLSFSSVPNSRFSVGLPTYVSPRSQPSQSRISLVPTLGSSPRSVPSGLSPRLCRKQVRLCRLRDRPSNPVIRQRQCNCLYRLP